MATIFDQLQSAKTTTDVERLIGKLVKEGYEWKAVGGDASNAGRIQMASEATRPVIERAVNAMDAVLELHWRRNGSRDVASPRVASSSWLGVKDGHLASLPEAKRQELAELIHVSLSDSGNKSKPNLTIRDKGIGIHPTEMPKTILALGGGNKLSKFHLCGAYGQGGSTTFAWCQYTIIVTRKQTDQLDGLKDEVGWTIVRCNDQDPTTKNDVYEYLVAPSGSMPTTKGSFEAGTLVRHVEYDLGKHGGKVTLEGYRWMNFLLFDPVLPLWMIDERDGQRRSIAGNVARLVDQQNVEYPHVYRETSGPLAGLRIRYWVMRVKERKPGEKQKFFLDSYLEDEGAGQTTVITLNGQVHGFLEKGFLKSKLQLSFLKNYLLVQIEADGLSRDMRKALFASTREKVREGEGRMDLLRSKLEDVLGNDPEIKRLEDDRREQFLRQTSEAQDDKVRKMLDRLISSANAPAGGAPGGGGQPIKVFKSKDPPKVLRVIGGENPIRLEPGQEKLVQIETDAPNDYLVRPKKAGSLNFYVSPGKLRLVKFSGPMNGAIRAWIRADADVPPGLVGTLVVSLTTHRKKVLKTDRSVLVVAPPTPPPTFDPPTEFEVVGDGVLRLRRGRKGVVQVRCNGPDGLTTRGDEWTFAPKFTGVDAVLITGVSDLVSHRVLVHFEVPKDAALGKATFQADLAGPSDLSLTTKRDCIIIDPPASGDTGPSPSKVPNYRIIPVQPNDEHWVSMGWDETWVGKWENSGGKLMLYVSLGYSKLISDLSTRKLAAESLESIKTRYTAMVAYHAYQHFQFCKESEVSVEDREVQPEFRRMANTMLLAMRSETDLVGGEP